MLNKTVIVTGASRGIGRSTAIRLAKDFSALVLVAGGHSDQEWSLRQTAQAGAGSG